MENAFLCGAVDYAASFIECFFNSFSVTSGDSFGRTADSGMNRRFNLSELRGELRLFPSF